MNAARRLPPYVVATLAAAVWVVPYAWMVSTAFKTLPEIVAHPTALLPDHLDPGAFHEVFAAMPVARYLGVTVLMATSIAAAQIALALPAGYALAKLHFAGRRFAFGIVLACLLVPAQATFVPVFLMFARARLIDTMTALVLPFSASAFGMFLVRQALLGVPDEIIEAARLDGAGEWTIVYRILAPMLRPTLVSLFLVSFVFHYSDYFWPLVMTTGDAVRTLPLGVALLREQGTGVRWHIVMAGNVVLSAPILVLFGFAQRHLLRAVAPPSR
ncbi:MAG TPA: carbohydrate ABC transporter permease [Polyangiaceae bacterium]|jgi:sn-glycerol 3-phosphate transport system permease protein|nr:carbohydrate ABC transporter permease [Polyangiaceae bacterium]